MVDKSEGERAQGGEKRGDLRERLIEAARVLIERDGLKALRARAITTQAGCALGALYTAFAGLDELVLHVNGRTLEALAAEVRPIAEAGDVPAVTLERFALAYAGFADANRHLWAALFDVTMLAGLGLPDWHRAQQEALLALIAAPLARLRPDLPADTLSRRARTLFAAVHGVVTLGLEDRFVGHSGSALEGELVALVRVMVKGLEEGA